MNNLLIPVQGMGRYNEMAQMNRRFWHHHFAPVVTLSPTDEPMQVRGIVNISLGLEGYTGWLSLDRWQKMLEWCAEQPFDYFLMHETDSICLTNELNDYLFDNPDTFFSNEMPENANPPIQGFYCLAPWFFSRKLVKEMVHYIPKLNFTGPANGDRWLGQILEQGGFKHSPFRRGIGCGTLSTAPDRMPELIQVGNAVRSGARFIHGVKTKDVQIFLENCLH